MLFYLFFKNYFFQFPEQVFFTLLSIGPDHLESIVLKIIGKKSIILLVNYNLLFQKIIDFLPIIQANNRQKIDYFGKL